MRQHRHGRAQTCPTREYHACFRGLGKTAQSIAVLEYQRQLCHVPGPFLVVAPLTTLGHWQREIQTWTPMVRVPAAQMSSAHHASRCK